MGKSFDGVSNFAWNKIFYSSRPGGNGTGSQHLFNKARFDQDPTHSSRWIGLISWSFNDGTSKMAGTTPAYIDYSRQVFGVQFQNKGWCEFPWGQEWTSFNSTAPCDRDPNTPPGNAIPDFFYRLPEFGGDGKNNQDLQIIDGKPLALQMFKTGQHCADMDISCIDAHAPCPVGQVVTPYETRRNDSTWDFGNYWTVREIDLSTWDETSPGHLYNGPRRTILDNPDVMKQKPQFHISPSDIGIAATAYHGGSIRQYSDGRVYLYLPIKHSLCLPESNPPEESWDRPGKGNSGASLIWLRLSY